MKKTMLTIAGIAMLALVACGDAETISDSKPMTDAQIVEQKAALSKDFMAIETLIAK